MAPGIAKSYISEIVKIVDITYDWEDTDRQSLKECLRSHLEGLNYHVLSGKGDRVITQELKDFEFTDNEIERIKTKARKYVEKEAYQAMEALVHNLNSMHSRAGRDGGPFNSEMNFIMSGEIR